MSKKAKYETENEVAEAVEAVEAVEAERILVLGSKVPKHRAGHNHDAWQAIAYELPCSAAFLASLPEVQACGGIKGNGMLFLGYAIRRGWLREIA